MNLGTAESMGGAVHFQKVAPGQGYKGAQSVAQQTEKKEKVGWKSSNATESSVGRGKSKTNSRHKESSAWVVTRWVCTNRSVGLEKRHHETVTR